MSGSAPEAEWAPGYTSAALLLQGRRARIVRATRVTSGAEVVLKVLPPDAGRAEIGHLQSLDGVPGAVPVLDAGTTSDGAFFVVLPFYPDGSFGEMLAKKGPAPIQEAAAVSRSVAAALGAVHGRGLVHNDVCPGNVLRAGRTPVLTGFGAVHRAGEALPPPPPSMESFLHAPPEALQGEPRTSASDIYQLASTIWTMLVGHAPFATTDGSPFDPHQYANRVLQDTPPPVRRSDISRSLRQVLTRALSKNPRDRYATTADFATAFERARTGRVATSPQRDGGQSAEQPPETTPAVTPSGPQAPLWPSGPQVPHGTVSSGPQDPHDSAQPDPRAPHGTAPPGHQDPPPQSPSGGQIPPEPSPSSRPRDAFEGPTPSSAPDAQTGSSLSAPAHEEPRGPYRPVPPAPVAPPPGPSPEHHREGQFHSQTPVPPPPVPQGTSPDQRTPETPHVPDAVQPHGVENTAPSSDDTHLGENAGARPRPRALPTPEERERNGVMPEEVPNGTADLMMARLRGEEISPLRAWSRLEGWRGDAESSRLPVEKGREKENEGWEALDVPPSGLPRWRRQMHIAVAVCGTLVVTLVTSSFAATNTSGPMIAAAENSDSEEDGGSDESGSEEQAATEAEPVEPSPPPEVAEPSGVALEDALSAVTLTWTDNSGGTADYFVLGSIRGQDPETLARTGPGAETAQVDTPNNSAEYCYTVIAVEGAASPADEVCTTRAADRAEAEREAEREAEEAAEEEEESEDEAASDEDESADDADDTSGSGSGSSDSGGGGSGSSGGSGD
ncbi:serine/threonine protein kinase [Nocardiopsis xinjiangensis]|uniref:serine/threonine protein kinase n=1 Tax=Nocardiopsis xinjiangensis TaxID=124285 RepID=UPI000348A504|nr:serine/threonine-protein kinase [Nocardiopsis xinjiangensis]